MKAAALTTILVVCAFGFVAAQPTVRTSPALVDASAAMIASAWTALASGRDEEAEKIADKLLQNGSRRHEAVSLKIFARAQAGRAEAALDLYEEWLRSAPHEDVFLLQPVAAAILQGQATATDLAIRVDALQALAVAGDKDAPARLGALASAAGVPGIGDEALVRILNPEAVARLSRLVASPGTRGDMSSAIRALSDARPAGAVATIAAALEPSRPLPTRMSAARALGLLGGAEALPQLRRALSDPEPPVRMLAAVSLARLGDQSGAELIREMETSPVTDIRLMAAEISAAGNPGGSWVSTATGALQDPDPLARLTAANLLLAHGPDPAAALSVLNQALSDPNPALRLAALRTLEQAPPEALATDLPAIRRLLRDSDPRIRIIAASALLKLAGGVE